VSGAPSTHHHTRSGGRCRSCGNDKISTNPTYVQRHRREFRIVHSLIILQRARATHSRTYCPVKIKQDPERSLNQLALDRWHFDACIPSVHADILSHSHQLCRSYNPKMKQTCASLIPTPTSVQQACGEQEPSRNITASWGWVGQSGDKPDNRDYIHNNIANHTASPVQINVALPAGPVRKERCHGARYSNAQTCSEQQTHLVEPLPSARKACASYARVRAPSRRDGAYQQDSRCKAVISVQRCSVPYTEQLRQKYAAAKRTTHLKCSLSAIFRSRVGRCSSGRYMFW
jgi:hypothetical protein